MAAKLAQAWLSMNEVNPHEERAVQVFEVVEFGWEAEKSSREFFKPKESH
jgi:hypothetical protein